MFEEIKENKVIIGVAAAVIAGIIGFTMMGGGETTAGDNAKIDNSKKVKSHVGDTTVGGNQVQLDGVSAGGDFNLDLSNKTSE